MSPLMQTIFDQLRFYDLELYIDSFQQEFYDGEIEQLRKALRDALPASSRDLLSRYAMLLNGRALLDLEAMFLAAFDAARELV